MTIQGSGRGLLIAFEFRGQCGLLTNDSLIIGAARDHGLTAIASADGDFGRLEGVQLYQPGDLASSPERLLMEMSFAGFG